MGDTRGNPVVNLRLHIRPNLVAIRLENQRGNGAGNHRLNPFFEHRKGDCCQLLHHRTRLLQILSHHVLSHLRYLNYLYYHLVPHNLRICPKHSRRQRYSVRAKYRQQRAFKLLLGGFSILIRVHRGLICRLEFYPT